MKVRGKVLAMKARRDVVVIGRDEEDKPVAIVVDAPGFGSVRRLKDSLPEPEAPPGEPIKDDRGRTRKDPTGKTLMARRTDDPGYLSSVAERSDRLLFLFIAEFARDVEWETKRTDHASADDYAKAIGEELRKAGLTEAGMVALARAFTQNQLDVATPEEVAEARRELGVVDPK